MIFFDYIKRRCKSKAKTINIPSRWGYSKKGKVIFNTNMEVLQWKCWKKSNVS